MVSWISALPRKRPARLQESAGRRGWAAGRRGWAAGRRGRASQGALGRVGGGLTLHLLREAVHIIRFIGVTDAIGSHTRKLILVSIATFPWSVDGVPAGNPK